jgi:hypothetical protein
MCEPISATMAAMSAGSAILGAKSTAKAEGAAEDARRKGQMEQIRQMTTANADSNLDLRDKSEQARQQLSELNLTSIRNKGMVNTAISESGVGGASMERIKRISAAESSRERMGVVDNYGRDYQTIFANQVSNVENTQAALRGSQPVMRTSKLAQALNIASAGASGYSQGSEIEAGLKKKK